MDNRKYLWISFMFAALVPFQNCGKGFEAVQVSAHSYGSTNGQDDNGGSGGSTSPSPVPTSKRYELPTTAVPLFAASKLNWTFDDAATNSGFQNSVDNLAGQCESRRATFLSVKKVVPVIKEEGNLPNSPNIADMKPVKDGLDQLPNVGFCVYFAASAAERAASLKAVTDYFAEWEATYVGDGNPINDRFFNNLFLVADLVAPKLTAAQYQTVQRMAERMDAKDVSFMNALGANDDRRKNNWMIHHLMIRVYTALFSTDTNRMAQVQGALNSEIARQYKAPSGFIASTCSNLAAIGSYGSYDLQQRDALFYHAFGLSSILPFLRLKPDLLTTESANALATAVTVLKPYVLNEKVHKEFTCTTVQFDRDRIALDPSAASNWNPDSQSIMFRYARLGVASTSAWTTRFVTPTYHPWFKLYFTGKGDVLN